MKKYPEPVTNESCKERESRPLVSVIIRTKDRPELLSLALQSILNQTYTPVETVVINDGGEDVENKVTEICRGTPFTYLSHERTLGRAASANSGLKAAKGEYLNLLDDDDVFYPHHIETLATALSHSNCKAVYSDCESARFAAGADGCRLLHKSLFSSVDFDSARLIFENFIPSMTVMFQRTLVKQAGLMDESFEIYEDWDYWIRISRLSPMLHLKNITAQYRTFDNEITGTTGTTGRGFDIWHWTLRIYQKHRNLWSPDLLIHYLRYTVADRIEELSLQISSKEELLSAKDRKIGEKDREIREKEHVIDSQTHAIYKKENEIFRVQKENNKTVYNLQSTIKQKEQEIDLLRRSFSWRITEPVRKIRSFQIRCMQKVRKAFVPLKSRLKSLLDTKERDRYAKWIEKYEPGPLKRAEREEESKKLEYQPLFSVIIPVYNISVRFLESAIQSVFSQIYPHWELCIADDASPDPRIKELLQSYKNKDPRVKVAFLEKNRHISAASNKALQMAKGEFVVLLDHDDEIAPHALAEFALHINQYPQTDMIYSDEDHIDREGKRVNPHFKPDWSPDLFLSQMYTCHLGCYRRDTLISAGCFRQGYEGSQDYDLVLRIMERTDQIFHIPKILYHWRMVDTSVAGNPNAKDYADQAALNAIADYLSRNGISGRVEKGLFKYSYRVRYDIAEPLLVSIIIPMKDQVEHLRRLISSIRQKTVYQPYEIIIVNNRSENPDTFDYFAELEWDERITILDFPHPFNFSAINNFAAGNASGDLLLFLNNDTEVMNPDWLDSMVEHCQRPEIGAVGARLHYPGENGIQHAGIIVGIGGYAGHAHKTFPGNHPGYFGRIQLIQNFSAVTGACLMTGKDLFHRTGGFNENELKIAANDVDYCLRLREQGFRIVYTPFAELIHYESISRGYEDTPEKKERFEKEKAYFAEKWSHILRQGDPYYNPNFTLDHEDFSLKR